MEVPRLMRIKRRRWWWPQWFLCRKGETSCMSVAQFSGAFTPTGLIKLLLCWFIWGEVRTHHPTPMRIKEANSSRSRSHSASDTGSGPGHGGIVGKLNPNKQTPRKPPRIQCGGPLISMELPFWFPGYFHIMRPIGASVVVSWRMSHHAAVTHVLHQPIRTSQETACSAPWRHTGNKQFSGNFLAFILLWRY